MFDNLFLQLEKKFIPTEEELNESLDKICSRFKDGETLRDFVNSLDDDTVLMFPRPDYNSRIGIKCFRDSSLNSSMKSCKTTVELIELTQSVVWVMLSFLLSHQLNSLIL